MDGSKQIIYPERMRRAPARFSWVDQRLVQDRHLDRLDVVAAALYLFLITVADARGMSWYGDTSTARRLSIDQPRLRRARGELISAGLLAYAKGLYQVLALDEPLPLPRHVAPERQASSLPTPPATERVTERIAMCERLAALHAALGKHA